jgi:HTH-type transcriptional regulator / antitoxin HipB
MPLDEISLRQRLAEDLKRWRKTWGLSQRWLAERASTSQQVISLLEAGRYNPSVGLLERLAAAMDMRLEVTWRPKPQR